MRVVKNILWVTICMLAVNTCVAQKTLEGTFSHGDLAVDGVEISYHFTDSTFKKITDQHLGTKELAKGSYEIAGDTLHLNYLEIIDPAPSKYLFSRRKDLPIPPGMDTTSVDKTKISVGFSTFDMEGKPLKGVSLQLRNKKGNTVMSFVSDSAGKIPSLSVNDNYIHDFTFNFIGYKPVSIGTDTLKGFVSNVKVLLSKSDTYYSQFSCKKSYLIKKRTKNEIVLETLENHREIILNRSD